MSRQGQRLTPQFSALQAALAAGRMQAGTATGEPDPELVVVFDLVATVDSFMRAASQIDGLEFLAEHDEDVVDADDDFYYEQDDGEPADDGVPETLYMVMTNEQAAAELVRLFALWQTDPGAQFPRGLAPLKTAFVWLRAVRRWGPLDRVRETGLLDVWREDVDVVGAQGTTRVEIELWYRDDRDRRARAQADVERIIYAAGGTVVTSATLHAIDYHAVMADLPFNQVEAVLRRGPEAIELLTTETVMLVAPARPMGVPLPEPADTPVVAPTSLPSAQTPPRVALLDGLPMANHSVLAGRLVIDDPDSIAHRYSSAQQQHGTAMASLICHGDLAAPGPAMSTRLYVRPIMEPHPWWPNVEEEIVSPDRLLTDQLHRSLYRMFEGEAGQPPTAPSVRVINLSLGDPVRVFARRLRLSPLAKLLDWACHRYNILVLVSAGNTRWQPTVPAAAVGDQEALRRELLSVGYSQLRQRRLFSPAEAVNVLTVGAIHSDATPVEGALPDTVLEVVEPGMPASYSAVGFGHRRSVKPEILMPGGRQLHQRPVAVTTDEITLTAARHGASGPGHLVAVPTSQGGVTGTGYLHGTSNATALASRAADQVFGLLADLDAGEDGFPFPDSQYHPVLVKALLVHAAHWAGLAGRLQSVLQLDLPRRPLTQLLGYGPVDIARLATAERTRMLLLGAGSIRPKERHRLSYPLPAALAATTDWRRLTVTLAWLSPVNTRSQVHRQARLRFTSENERLRLDRKQADHNAVRKGTVQHEIFEGDAAVAFTAGEVLGIDVDCRFDAGRCDLPIRYGIAATLEVQATIQADLHAQVREALRAQVRQLGRVAART